MQQELDDGLCAKYPLIFAQRNLDKTETCMCWGFECGDGWYDLIDSLCYTIQSYLNSHTEVKQVVATQVKSKFGGLRFYTEGGNAVTDGMITLAETISEKILDGHYSLEDLEKIVAYIKTLNVQEAREQ